MIDGKIVDLGGVGTAQVSRSRLCIDQGFNIGPTPRRLREKRA